MTNQDNLKLAQLYFDEIMNQGNLELVDEIFAPDFEFRITTIPTAIPGPGGMKQFVTTLRSAFPDIKFDVDHYICEGDRVLARWRLHGTHKAPFLGIPPTGNAVQDHGNDIFHFRDGQFTRAWVNEDSLGLMRQLGALPAA